MFGRLGEIWRPEERYAGQDATSSPKTQDVVVRLGGQPLDVVVWAVSCSSTPGPRSGPVRPPFRADRPRRGVGLSTGRAGLSTGRAHRQYRTSVRYRQRAGVDAATGVGGSGAGRRRGTGWPGGRPGWPARLGVARHGGPVAARPCSASLGRRSVPRIAHRGNVVAGFGAIRGGELRIPCSITLVPSSIRARRTTTTGHCAPWVVVVRGNGPRGVVTGG